MPRGSYRIGSIGSCPDITVSYLSQTRWGCHIPTYTYRPNPYPLGLVYGRPFAPAETVPFQNP